MPSPIRLLGGRKPEAAGPAYKDTQAALRLSGRRPWVRNELALIRIFSKLGGHSMIAVQVMTQLEKETGKRLPLSTLLTYPTIRKLASLFQADAQPTTWKSLVPIKPQGSKVPIYIIHGIGLNLLNFSSLVSYMDAEQPIYGLQALGLDGEDEPLDNMEAIADFYLSEVMVQNPTGPYAIAGYSFGGYVALEMARQLKADGQRSENAGYVRYKRPGI